MPLPPRNQPMRHQYIAEWKHDDIANIDCRCAKFHQQLCFCADQWAHAAAARPDPDTRTLPAVILKRRTTGLLTPIGDAAAFASAVARLLDAPDERARLAAAAAARVAAHHDEDAAARALAVALRSLR